MADMTLPTATVNGVACGFEGMLPTTSALDWLRTRGLNGAKEGCAEGECGACSILVARPAGGSDDPGSRWTAINACLVPAASLDGQQVVTSEGLGTASGLHLVQHEMAMRGGSQCGYCTPGFVCSMAAEYYRPGRSSPPDDTPPEPEHGNNGFDLHVLRATSVGAPATAPSGTPPSLSVLPPRATPSPNASGAKHRMPSRPVSWPAPAPTRGPPTSPTSTP